MSVPFGNNKCEPRDSNGIVNLSIPHSIISVDRGILMRGSREAKVEVRSSRNVRKISAAWTRLSLVLEISLPRRDCELLSGLISEKELGLNV